MSSEETGQHQVERLIPTRPGHYRLESGHHGDRWLDLELLFFHPAEIHPLAAQLADALRSHAVQAVCGPLVEGAFLATMVAPLLGVPFTYTDRRVSARADPLFAVDYPLPPVLRAPLQGRRVAIVNDVINAGSAVRGTLASLRACGAQPVVIGALATLGGAAARLAAEAGVGLETLATIANEIWTPADCPLCARQIPLDDPR